MEAACTQPAAPSTHTLRNGPFATTNVFSVFSVALHLFYSSVSGRLACNARKRSSDIGNYYYRQFALGLIPEHLRRFAYELLFFGSSGANLFCASTRRNEHRPTRQIRRLRFKTHCVPDRGVGPPVSAYFVSWRACEERVYQFCSFYPAKNRLVDSHRHCPAGQIGPGPSACAVALCAAPPNPAPNLFSKPVVTVPISLYLSRGVRTRPSSHFVGPHPPPQLTS